MGGTESVVSMGWMVLFLVILYLAGVGISSLIRYLRKKWKERKNNVSAA